MIPIDDDNDNEEDRRNNDDNARPRKVVLMMMKVGKRSVDEDNKEASLEGMTVTILMMASL